MKFPRHFPPVLPHHIAELQRMKKLSKSIDELNKKSHRRIMLHLYGNK